MPARPTHLQPSVALPLITGLTRASASRSRRPPATAAPPSASASASASTAAAAAGDAAAASAAGPSSSSRVASSSNQQHSSRDGQSEATAHLTSSQRIVSEALLQHRAGNTIVKFLRRSVEIRRKNHGIRAGDDSGDGSDSRDGDEKKKRGQQHQQGKTKWVVGGNDKKRRRTAKTPPPKKAGDDAVGDGGGSGNDGEDATPGGKVEDDTNGADDNKASISNQKKEAVVGTTTLGIAQSHWAWSSLMAPSLRVRRATTRLLLDGIVPPSPTPITAHGGPCSESLDQLIATLLDLADQNLFRIGNDSTSSISTTGSSINASLPSDDAAHNGRRGYGMDTGGDPSLQLLGLLSHLVTEEPVLRMASERSVLDQMAAAGGAPSRPPTSTSSLVSPAELIESDRSIESFVASGGLRWVAASLLRVVVELTTRTTAAASSASGHGTGGDDMELLTEASSLPSSPRPCGGSDETELETLQSRLVALVDLLYRIVLYAGLTHCDYWKVESSPSLASTNATTAANTLQTPSSPPPLASASATAASIGMENRQKSTLLDKSRQKRRQDALSKVHDLLWSSTVPALSVTTGGNGSGEAAAKLSPLACVVASYELLKAGSSNGGSPYLSGRNRGLDRALACLNRIVDVSATVSVQLPTSTAATTTTSANSKRGESSTAGRGDGGSTADRALGLGSSRNRGSLSGSRAARRRRLTSRRTNPYSAAGGGSSSSAAAQRAYSNSLASSLLGLASPGGAESDPFAAAGFGSPDSSSSAAVARSVSAAMSALDRARARGSAGGALPMALDDIVDDSDDDDDRSNHGGSGQQRSQPQHGHGHEDEHGDSDDDDDDDHRDRDEEDPDAAYDRETDMEGQGGKDDDEDDEEIPSDDEDIAPARAQPVDMEIDEPFDDSLLVVDDDGQAGLHDSEADVAAARAMAAASAALESPASSSRLRITSPGPPRGTTTAKKPSAATKGRRKSAYLKTGMSLLEAQHASSHHSQRMAAVGRSSPSSTIVLPPPILTTAAEQSLLKSMCDIIRPQKKPVNLKMFLRRAPTQEEFFRGNLTRNPVSLAHLTKNRAGSSAGAAGDGAGQGSGGNEPTVRDLRDHIAKDLQVGQQHPLSTLDDNLLHLPLSS